MKKVIIISILGIAIFLSALFFFLCFNVFPKGSCKISSNYVDNRYNNCCLSDGNVIEINNKLYFNYNGNDSIFFYGIYEIGDNNSKRIYWDGPSFSPGNNLYKLQVYNNNLLFSNYTGDTSYEVSQNEIIPQFDENIYSFDLQKHQVNKLYSLKSEDEACEGYYYIINNKIYVFSNDKIYVSDDGISVEELFSGLSSAVNKTAYEKLCYISDDTLIYVSNDNNLVKYDLLKNEQIGMLSLSSISNNTDNYGEVFICNGKSIITTYDGDIISVYDVSEKPKLIYSKQSTDYYSINSFEDNVFISSKSIGLDMIDIKTGDTKTLVNTNVNDTYIFDDKWVYYVDSSGILNRIMQTGEHLEAVFK